MHVRPYIIERDTTDSDIFAIVYDAIYRCSKRNGIQPISVLIKHYYTYTIIIDK